MDDLEQFAARLVAEWHDDPRAESTPVERWLTQYACLVPQREPDSCPDAVSSLPGREHSVRWYDDGEHVIAFWGDRRCSDVPWDAIDAFLRRSQGCDDDELPFEPVPLPLAG